MEQFKNTPTVERNIKSSCGEDSFAGNRSIHGSQLILGTTRDRGREARGEGGLSG